MREKYVEYQIPFNLRLASDDILFRRRDEIVKKVASELNWKIKKGSIGSADIVYNGKDTFEEIYTYYLYWSGTATKENADKIRQALYNTFELIGLDPTAVGDVCLLESGSRNNPWVRDNIVKFESVDDFFTWVKEDNNLNDIIEFAKITGTPDDYAKGFIISNYVYCNSLKKFNFVGDELARVQKEIDKIVQTIVLAAGYKEYKYEVGQNSSDERKIIKMLFDNKTNEEIYNSIKDYSIKNNGSFNDAYSNAISNLIPLVTRVVNLVKGA